MIQSFTEGTIRPHNQGYKQGRSNSKDYELITKTEHSENV